MSLHLKDNFAFGIRPSDDGAIVAPSSQLGPVHLHIKIIKWKRATLFVMSIRLCASCLNAEQITKWKFSENRITYVPINWPNLFYILAFEFPFDSPIEKRDEPVRPFEYRHLPIFWTAGKNGIRRVETTCTKSRYLPKRHLTLFESNWINRLNFRLEFVVMRHLYVTPRYMYLLASGRSVFNTSSILSILFSTLLVIPWMRL